MKSIILLLCLISFAPFAAHAYKHKSEAEIIRMTPAQRVDEWVNEYVYHTFSLHEQKDMLRKYVKLDGLKAMPRMIEIINEYDPTRFREGKGRRGERFDACWQMLGYIDHDTVRLRGSEEGKQAIDALEQSLGRMKAANYGQPDQHEWAQHGRFDLIERQIKHLRGINITDEGIQTTFRLKYKTVLSDIELLEFVNFLTANYPQYPSWSERDFIKDYTQINEAGNPLQMYAVKKPERYYEAYLEFKNPDSLFRSKSESGSNYKVMNNDRFSVIVEKDADGYFASCNELQGCYTQGETYEEVIKNIRDAISLHVEDRIESGEEIRQPQAVSLTLMDLAV